MTTYYQANGPSGPARPSNGRCKKGSILLMVVGLLTIIGMLGTTFLLISRMDARQSAAMAERAQVDPIASGVVIRLQSLLAEDLHCDTTAPYATLGSTPADYYHFVDYPSADCDDWLTAPSAWSDPNVAASHWANFGDPNVNAPGAMRNDPNNVADTDGNGVSDSWVYHTGVTTPNGDEFCYAVQVLDTGGMLNLTTAVSDEPNDFRVGGTPNDPNLIAIHPVHVSLRRFFDDLVANDPNVDANVYLDLNGADPNLTFPIGRNPNDVEASKYRNWVRSALTDPNDPNPFSPFAVGDEVVLRWADEGDPNLPALSYGRLGDPNSGFLKSVPMSARRHLTTWNCSRSIPRVQPNPTFGPSFATRFSLVDPNDPNGFGNPGVRDNLRKQIVSVTGGDWTAAMHPKNIQAAHLVANLWAATAADPNGIFPMTLPGPPFDRTVFGVTEQLVISEAYGFHYTDPDPNNSADTTAAIAVELVNPTSIPINTDKYYVKVGATGTPQPLGPATVPAGGRLVLYHVDPIGSIASLGGPANINSFFDPNTGGSIWRDISELKDFNESSDIYILKSTNIADPAQTQPLDKVAAADIGFTPSGTLDAAGITIASGQRDDDPNRQHVMLPVYVNRNPPSTPATSWKTHTLGLINAGTANGIVGTEAEFATLPQGFDLNLPHKPLRSIGQLAGLYVIGSESWGPAASRNLAGLPQQLAPYADPNDLSRGKVDLRQAIVAGSTRADMQYPDVPWATLMGELFELVPPDAMRDTPATRTYGKVNINTASREVLIALPWPKGIDFNGDGDPDPNNPSKMPGTLAERIDPNVVADTIIAYRDMKVSPAVVGKDYADRAAIAGTGILGLRASTNERGFLTPGEVAIPLADCADSLMPAALGQPMTAIRQMPKYLQWRNSLYSAVANVVTVNSDVFVANIVVQLRSPNNPVPKNQWKYVVMLDRSNCRVRDTVNPNNTHRPAVLLFTEVK